jgi:excisionase family DNA binding protein
MSPRNRQQEVTREVGQSPWLTVKEAATRARCGVKTIYREVRAGRLRAARVGGRRELRLLPEWVDAWLLMGSTGDSSA